MAASVTPAFRLMRVTTPVLLVAPLLLFMVVFYALPVLTMLTRSIAEPTWTLVSCPSNTG